jgi:hypothetical protein
MARQRTAPRPSGSNILVIDDREEVLTSTQFLPEREGHHVLTTTDGGRHPVPAPREHVSLTASPPWDKGRSPTSLRGTDGAIPESRL